MFTLALIGSLGSTGTLSVACTAVEHEELWDRKCGCWYKWVVSLLLDAVTILDHSNKCYERSWHRLFLAVGFKRTIKGSLHSQHVSSDNVRGSSKRNSITVSIVFTCLVQDWSQILVKTSRISQPDLCSSMQAKYVMIRCLRLVGLIRPVTTIPVCSSVVVYGLVRAATLNTGAIKASIWASSVWGTSSPRVVPWLILSCSSTIVFVALALLYRDTKHLTWYWASYAIRSAALGLARSGLSSNFGATFLTFISKSNIEALRR